MASKKSNKNPDSQQSEKPTKSRPPLSGTKLARKSKPNLPDWYPNNTEIEKAEISPELTPQEIIIPEEPKPDPIEVKRKRKTTEMENIVRRVMRSELGKLVIEE
ncbi:3178_t:CDS:2 [Diversispora eburnea]|uniref:3178_t:CDS:1 n=1 Tax=Diversispora eburnea TaxID=1213867 RepID=A0A9N9CLG8_9GLOM|nr:3178_t:CDS:2 [Diversispora eburnea]